MITRQELEGKWTEVKGRIQEKWGMLTDDELQRVRGNANALVGVIEQKTGATRSAIEEFLDEAVAGGASAITGAMESAREFAGKATDKATEFAGKASEKVRQQYDDVAESVRAGYEEAEEMVRRKPVESVAVAFGAGIVTGVLVGLLLHHR